MMDSIQFVDLISQPALLLITASSHVGIGYLELGQVFCDGKFSSGSGSMDQWWSTSLTGRPSHPWFDIERTLRAPSP